MSRPQSAARRIPGLEEFYMDEKIVVGIRPGLISRMQRARLRRRRVSGRWTVKTDVNELLGSESLCALHGWMKRR